MRSSSVNIKLKPLKYNVSVRTIALNTTGKNQYENEQVHYDLPDTSSLTYKVGRYQTKWTKEKQDKMTYVDRIFANGKKPEKSTPSPSAYKPDPTVYNLPKTVS